MRTTIFGTLLLIGLASPAFASDRSDFEVYRDASAQVNHYVYFTIFDNVAIGIDAGYVTLSGKVTMPFKAAAIEKRVARVDGVKGVKNTIEVLPVSLFDDDLRWNIARALYANPALSRYGVGPTPSIHVIVEHGRVTLNGVVDFDMDKVVASMVARSFPAFGVTNELKTNDEMQQLLEKLR